MPQLTQRSRILIGVAVAVVLLLLVGPRFIDGYVDWLFFGEQHEASDFYYRDEIEKMHDDGLLTELDLAFSRDGQEKTYVQDRMRARGAELWKWLEAGAHFYVCGDANRMAKDVDTTLREIVREHGHRTEAEAASYVTVLSSEKRYVRDVY